MTGARGATGATGSTGRLHQLIKRAAIETATTTEIPCVGPPGKQVTRTIHV